MTERICGVCFSAMCSSVNQLGLSELLAWAALLGMMPRCVAVLGVQPAAAGPSLELSPQLASRLPLLVQLVRKELEGPASTACAAGGTDPARSS